ncbi:hypothetical protein BLNAU_855 [Blattamonas nauphoetae]|uniref:Ribosomal RNA-processing protein 42 n=1 Tax=Blattamonas nauphoetae TaxID=2049346 RepID=A0ABQ9YL88_9EUKA|nr:hypothetical protein BLNAU_855 [Blattamonas nauphoetae]
MSTPAVSFSSSAEFLKKVRPKQFFDGLFSATNTRFDNRTQESFRPCSVTCRTIPDTLGSCVVKHGANYIVSTVVGSLSRKTSITSKFDSLIAVNVQYSSQTHPQFENAQMERDRRILFISSFLESLIGQCIDESSLSLQNIPLKNRKSPLSLLAWSLTVDITILEEDGDPTDAAVLSCFMGLKSVKFPELFVSENPHTRSFSISPVQPENEIGRIAPAHLEFITLPICVTFGIVNTVKGILLLADPSEEELTLPASTIRFVIDILREQPRFLMLEKDAGIPLDFSKEIHLKPKDIFSPSPLALDVALGRAKSLWKATPL